MWPALLIRVEKFNNQQPYEHFRCQNIKAYIMEMGVIKTIFQFSP